MVAFQIAVSAPFTAQNAALSFLTPKTKECQNDINDKNKEEEVKMGRM